MLCPVFFGSFIAANGDFMQTIWTGKGLVRLEEDWWLWYKITFELWD
jgi:hypothetical protein